MQRVLGILFMSAAVIHAGEPPPPPNIPAPMNAAEIQLGFQKLNVLGRVLYVAAHPDDENTNLMALFSNGALYDTAYLSATRGDGGQNLIGPELGERLGFIRTHELLAARKIDHARQFFTRAVDFGFFAFASDWRLPNLGSHRLADFVRQNESCFVLRSEIAAEGQH